MEEFNNNEIKIVLPGPEDFEGVQDVFYKTWLATYPNKEIGILKEDVEEYFKERLNPERKTRFIESIANNNPNYRFIIAKIGRKVVGVCGFSKKEGYNELQLIYVLPEFQGQGIGKKLWSDGVIFFGKSKRVIVNLATYNYNAQKFYESLGFKDTGKRFTEERHRMPVSKVAIPEMEMEIVL